MEFSIFINGDTQMKKFISIVATSLMLLLVSNTASAVPIQGRIDFIGGASITNTATAVTAIKFDTVNVSNFGPTVTGDFDTLEGSLATFTDLDLSAFMPTTLWQVGGFTFTITDVVDNIIATSLGITRRTLVGNGHITGNGFDQTAATWAITAQGNTKYVSFSSTAIPAPAGTALLGLCLLGFAFSRRNKKA